MFPLTLSARVGFGLDNQEDDVKATATNLSWLGYPEAETAAETGQWDDGAETGLRNFQRERGITVDGWAAPGGETERTLNGDLPNGGTIHDEAPLIRSSGFGRFLSGRPDAGDGRTSGSLLDLDAPARATPFLAARARFAREGALGRPDALSRTRDAGEVSLGENTVTGEPLKVKQPPRSSQETNPPMFGALDEVERTLTSRGYRYRPDPMGRIGEGDWIDANGRVLSAIDKDRALGNSRHNEVGSASADPSEVGRPSVTMEIDDDDDEDAAETHSDVLGGAEPANFFDRVLQGVFGRKSKDAWLRTGKLPTKVKERVDQIKNEKTRRAIEALLDGSDDETLNPKHDHSAIKRTGKYGAHFDFERYVHRAGGTMRDTKPTYDHQTGKQNGRRYTTEDGVNVILRFKGKDESTHIEIQVPKGRDLQRIKLRYRVREFIRGKR